MMHNIGYYADFTQISSNVTKYQPYQSFRIILLKGKCARDLLKKKKGKGKRRKELKQMKKKLRERWCKKPDMLSNGKVATPCGLGLFQTAISSCDKGYKLIPKESKKGRCELNKKWSGKKPECKAGKTHIVHFFFYPAA